MSITFNKDIFNNLTPPAYILTKANNDRIHTLNCTKKNYSFRFNTPDIVQFTAYMLIDNMKNPAYDSITEGQFIEVDGFGRFIISSVKIGSEGKEFEYKDCEAIGIETMLGQKYLELFTINMGTTESLDGVKFYNLANPDKSLLHLVLEKFPDWTIGHVDTALMTVERCFEITRQDVYSFLTQDIATAFQCVFIFDTLHQRINVYSEENVGSNTDIFVTYDNLLKSTNISSSIDDIKTCLTVKGADELNLREVNMGYDKIYMLDYFHSLEFMSKGLYEAYDNWVKKWNDNISAYSSLLSQYQNYYNQINNLTNVKMPSDPDNTNWTEYGLNPLKEKLAAYEQRQSVMIKAGQGNKDHKDYNSMYLPVFNTINAIKSQISIVENQITSLRSKQSSIGEQMSNIITDINMKNNFTSDQLQELAKFIREDELSTTNFVVTDSMTDSERMDMLKEMLEFGQKELQKVSQPQLQFSAEMLNLFETDAFKNCSANFEPGNYINIILRDDYIVKARLLTIDVDFYNPTNFSVTFGNMNKVKKKNIFVDVTNAIDTATSVATTVSFNSSDWNRANKNADDINKMLADGLLAAGESLKTSKSDVTIDDRGIVVSNTPDSKYPYDRIFIGNSQILFSDDDFKSIKTALGRVQYTKKGVTYDDFGLLAQFVIAGYIAGSTIEGNEILAGTITGSHINNGNGTFSVDENGYLISSAGNIAGWELSKNAIYNNIPFTNQKNSKSTGMGTYGGNWAFWAGNGKFSVDQDGNLVAETGKIGGAEIGATYLQSSNGNWKLDSSGSGTFKNVHISGVNAGSSFGTIGWNGSNNWGTFGGASYFGSNASNPFSGTTIPHIQTIAADYIKVSYLDAINASIGNLYAKDAEIENLVATKASVEQLNAAVANIEKLYVKSADIDSLIANKIKSSKISTDQLTIDGRPATWKSQDIVVAVEAREITVAGTIIHDIKRVATGSIYYLN